MTLISTALRDDDFVESYKKCLCRFEELTGGFDSTLWVYRVTRIDTGEVLYEALSQLDIRMSFSYQYIPANYQKPTTMPDDFLAQINSFDLYFSEPPPETINGSLDGAGYEWVLTLSPAIVAPVTLTQIVWPLNPPNFSLSPIVLGSTYSLSFYQLYETKYYPSMSQHARPADFGAMVLTSVVGYDDLQWVATSTNSLQWVQLV